MAREKITTGIDYCVRSRSGHLKYGSAIRLFMEGQSGGSKTKFKKVHRVCHLETSCNDTDRDELSEQMHVPTELGMLGQYEATNVRTNVRQPKAEKLCNTQFASPKHAYTCVCVVEGLVPRLLLSSDALLL